MTRSNPLTSVDGWESTLRDAKTIKERVREIVATHGPLTLDGICDEYRRYRNLYGWPLASESGIRSRCAELVKAGTVVQAGIGASRYGNTASLWRATNV